MPHDDQSVIFLANSIALISLLIIFLNIFNYLACILFLKTLSNEEVCAVFSQTQFLIKSNF